MSPTIQPANRPLDPGLYVVATPIGNLGDITLRAARILAAVDAVAAEDTRMGARLLQHLALKTPLIAYHDHNAARARPQLIARLQAGERIALISDAGTPLISDPGYKLLEAAIAAGIMVTTAPGPCAAIAALTLAGLPTDRFLFAGFLPPRTKARKEVLAELAALPATLIFYEGPSRLAASLADMAVVLGDRPAAIARELTKLHEEVRRDSLAQLAAAYAQEPAPKGELVVLVGPPPRREQLAPDSLDALLLTALATQGVAAAARAVADATGQPRGTLYARALALKAQP